MSTLKTGARHLWVERDGRARGPFNIIKIDGDTVTITRLPTGTVETIDVSGDPYTIVGAVNSYDLAWQRGDITAFPANTGGNDPWYLRVVGEDISAEGNVKPHVIGDQRAALFSQNFAALAAFAKKRYGVTGWARERFGAWVPANDWRAVTPGVPCTHRGCDRVIDRDNLCKLHASSEDRVAANEAVRQERAAVRRDEASRKKLHRQLCQDAIERLTPLLADLGIHPQTVVLGEGAGERIGVLIPAEAAELLVSLAYGEHEMLVNS